MLEQTAEAAAAVAGAQSLHHSPHRQALQVITLQRLLPLPPLAVQAARALFMLSMSHKELR
jgi:hypothetical protein